MLKLEGVSFLKGSVSILENLNIELVQGERCALIGPSGAGKTTLLRLLNRLIEPTRGEIFWQGQPLKQLPIKIVRTSLVLLPQRVKLLGMRADEAIIYPLKLQKLAPLAIIERLDYWRSKCTLLDRLLEKSEWELSLGERQIVALVRALIMRPKILLLDEPTSAIDPSTAEKVIELLSEVAQAESITMIMVSHQFDLLQQFVRRVFYLEEGLLLEDTTSARFNWSSCQERLLNFPTESDF